MLICRFLLEGSLPTISANSFLFWASFIWMLFHSCFRFRRWPRERFRWTKRPNVWERRWLSRSARVSAMTNLLLIDDALKMPSIVLEPCLLQAIWKQLPWKIYKTFTDSKKQLAKIKGIKCSGVIYLQLLLSSYLFTLVKILASSLDEEVKPTGDPKPRSHTYPKPKCRKVTLYYGQSQVWSKKLPQKMLDHYIYYLNICLLIRNKRKTKPTLNFSTYWSFFFSPITVLFMNASRR